MEVPTEKSRYRKTDNDFIRLFLKKVSSKKRTKYKIIRCDIEIKISRGIPAYSISTKSVSITDEVRS